MSEKDLQGVLCLAGKKAQGLQQVGSINKDIEDDSSKTDFRWIASCRRQHRRQ